ncbi:mucin-4 [Gopherus evgoodei]|uniref:mucin-4 n=1 Tax=Gopherus evgoodei TaxID=1825980 RepID=UPI0011CEDBCB|nr:mucin-4 [Gopherus evgoodei]
MGPWSPVSWACLGCWLWTLQACAALEPTSAIPEDEFTPGAGSPTQEGSLLRARVLAAIETAVTSAARSPPSLSDTAANPDVTTLPGESTISSSHASEASASFPTEVATASLVSAVNGDNVNSVPETASSPLEPVASGSEAGEIPTEEAETSASVTNSLHASPENRRVAMTPAGEAVATLALFYSSPTDPHPTRFSHSELEVTGSIPGAFSSVTTSSPLSAAPEDRRATPGTGGEPEDLASTGTVVSNGTPPSPSVGEVESTPAAFLSPAASPTEAPVSETESPGHDGSSAPKSPEPPSESETFALAGETSPPAFVAGWEEAGSLGPAETEGEGLSPSAFPSITGAEHLASESKTVTAPAAPEGGRDTGKSVSDTNEETPISAIDTQSQTNPSPADAEQSLANTEELPTGDPGALSNAKTSPRSFLEPGTVTAISTAPSAIPSPRDIPAKPSVSESESTGSSSAGLSGAPSSPQPLPDAAVGTAPVATGVGEELANSANASLRGTPLAPSVLESASLAATAKGPAGANVSGGFASGVAASSNVELAATTSHAGTRSETDPSPWSVELSPAPMDNLPTGEPGALAVDSPQPSSARETALAPAPAENRGDMASLVPVAHGETPISNPNLQSATNPSPSVPEQSPGEAELPAGETAALASTEASPRAPLGDRTVTGRLAPSGGTSPPAFASPSGAPAEPETMGDATNRLSGALGAPHPAPPRETSAGSEGTSASIFVVPGDPASVPTVSDSPGGPSTVGSAPPSSAGERVTVPPVAIEGRGDVAGSASAANEETTTSNPDAQHAEASRAGGAELPPGERDAWVNAETSPYSSLGDGRVTPGAGGGPEDLASTGTVVSNGTPPSPSVGEVESTPAAFLSPAASPTEAPVSETESPGHDGSSAPKSPEPPSESETFALAGETFPPAFVAGWEEAGSLGPAETEGEGLSPSAFPSITGAEHLASESKTVTAPAAPEGGGDTGKSVSDTNEETPISVIDTQSQTNPSPADAEQSLANTEELPTGDPGALSNAKTSPRSFLEPGTVTAISTAPSAIPSPRDIPAKPSVSESESIGSSSAGLSGAPSSPQQLPDAAVGTAPVATGVGEELANSANASVRGAPLAPSVLESASPAATAKGPAGANVFGGFASGVAASSNVELAATTSRAGTWSETDPSPWSVELSPAPMDNLPTGEPGALAVDSPQPSSARETALAPAPAENRGDMASLVPVAHGETPISNPNLQSATNSSSSVPEQSPGEAELPAGETAALASTEASPRAPFGDRTVTGRLAPSGGTSPPAFASPSGAPVEPETMGDATNGLSGALGAPHPAPPRETSAGSEGTSASIFVVPGDPASVPTVSDSPGGPSTVGSAPPSSAGERVTVPPVAIEGRGNVAGSASAANEETTTSNPDAQHAEASQAGGAELPPGERDAWVNAETSSYSSLGDGRVTGIHTPSGETTPAAFASPGETAAGPSASETAWPGPSFPSAPVPSPSFPERPTVIGPAGVAKEAAISASDSGVPAAFPALQAVTGQSLTTLRLATSCTPAATGSHSPSLHSEKGKTPPEPGANLGLSGVSHVPAATTPAPSRGRAATPFPLLGTTALRSDTRAGFVQERTASVSAGTREAATSGTGQSATVAAVPLYPYGAKESDKQYVERRVDFNSHVFKPEIGFPFGKTLRDSLYFTDNGQIIFPASDSDVFPSPNPPPRGFTGREKVPVVAVFWANADFSKGVGSTFYQEFVTLGSAEHPFVQDVETKIRRYLKTSYSAKWTLKITWEKAPAYPAWQPITRTNTYQAVLTTDGIKSYVLILYQDGGMQWDYTKLGLTSVLMGYSSGDGFYRNDDLTRRPPAAKYRPDQFRGYNTDLRGLWIYSLASHVRVNYRLRCLAWLSTQQDPASWNRDLPSCPCSLRHGALDRHYRWSRRGLADARVTMLYPASPNQYGAGIRCLYNKQNKLIDGRQERTWKASRQASPDRDAELKLHDWCCRQARSPQLCAKYSQKRPKISCAEHRLPNQTTSSEESASHSEEARD